MPLSGSTEGLTESGAALAPDESKAPTPTARAIAMFFIIDSFTSDRVQPLAVPNVPEMSMSKHGLRPTLGHVDLSFGCQIFPVGTMAFPARSSRTAIGETADENTFFNKYGHGARL